MRTYFIFTVNCIGSGKNYCVYIILPHTLQYNGKTEQKNGYEELITKIKSTKYLNPGKITKNYLIKII